MLIAKLTISFDRGLAHNDTRDLKPEDAPEGFKIAGRGDKTADGKVIRGLGTHFRSEEDAILVAEREKEARRVYNEFRSRFLATPIDGLYVVPKPGIAKAFVESLGVRPDIAVRVTEFRLESPGGLDGAELGEWATRIKRQLSGVSLGRSKEADAEGLRALETLASCPVLTPSTASRIKELVAMVRENRLTRLEIKRKIETMDVEIETKVLAPRQTPALVQEAA